MEVFDEQSTHKLQLPDNNIVRRVGSELTHTVDVASGVELDFSRLRPKTDCDFSYDSERIADGLRRILDYSETLKQNRK